MQNAGGSLRCTVCAVLHLNRACLASRVYRTKELRNMPKSIINANISTSLNLSMTVNKVGQYKCDQ